MSHEEIAGVEGFGFEGWTVGGNEKPVADFAGQKLDGAERGKFAAECSIGGVGGFRENEPKAVIARRFGVIAEHADDAVPAIDSESGKHAAHFGAQGRERIEDERVRRLLFRLGGAGHGFYGEHSRLGEPFPGPRIGTRAPRSVRMETSPKTNAGLSAPLDPTNFGPSGPRKALRSG